MRRLHLSSQSQLRREEGASLVEFAFSFGIFIAITFGILVLCWALFTYEYVDFAAREAARWAIVRGGECSLTSSMPGCPADQTAISNYVKTLNYPLIDTNNLTVTAGWYQANTYYPSPGSPTTWSYCLAGLICNHPGNEVQVTVSYNFAYGIPFFGDFTPTVSSTSTMVISQ
jgi:Flp pilus assembly protein TadG